LYKENREEVITLSDEKNIWPAGIKRTRQRESILSVLRNSDNPLCAADICSKMDIGNNGAWLSTVYRTLELFVQKGVVLKTNMINSEMAVYEINRFEHKHYAVCMNCHKVITMDNCPMENFLPELEDGDFQIMGHNLEVFGYCKNCHSNDTVQPE